MRCLLSTLLCATWLASVHAATPELIAPFSTASPGTAVPPGWRHTEIRGAPRPTHYALVAEDGRTMVKAEADGSASALVHAVAATHATLHWQWKVSRVLTGSNPYTREGDDYAARVYVTFDYPLDRLPLVERLKLRAARTFFDPDVPTAALCYVWDARLPAGTTFPSPYTPRVRIIVVDSGAEHVGRWRAVDRDLDADFRTAFGEPAPPVTGVAIAADTDNTRERATAWFGDIVLKKRAVNAPPSR